MPTHSALDCLAEFARRNGFDLDMATRRAPHGMTVKATLTPPPSIMHPTDAGIVTGPSLGRTRHEFSAQAASQDLALHRLWECIQIAMRIAPACAVVLPDVYKTAEGMAVRLVFSAEAWESVRLHSPSPDWLDNDFGPLSVSFGVKPGITHNKDKTVTIVMGLVALPLLVNNLRQPYQESLRKACE